MNKLVKYIRKIVGQEKVMNQLSYIEQNQRELLKANMFHDVIVDSEWLKYKNFLVGGAAIDYACSYTLFRVLSQMKPQHILEFGLGQSSKLIHQYASFFGIPAVTIEHSEEWISFFKNHVGNQYGINIEIAELEDVVYKGEVTLSYKGIQETLKGKKFDFVFVDGPYGFLHEHFSRPQIIDVVKYNLKDSFCVVMDDYNRSGEKETVAEVLKVLDEKGITYEKMVYSGQKEHILICSKDLYLLTTLASF